MKTVVITGATSGIGLAVCREMLRNNYHVIGIGHSKENCEKAKTELKTEIPENEPVYFYGDFMQQSEIKRVAGDVSRYLENQCGGELYALINNAGCVRSWYSTTEDGFEQQFALNHLAPFLLTHYMLPFLQKSKGRILLTSSDSHKMMKMHWKDIMYKKGYNPLLVYKQSKLCNMLFAYELNEKFSSCGVQAYGIDPGLVKTDIGFKKTGGLVKFIWSMRIKSGTEPSVPAKNYLWVCEQNPAPTKLYYYLCREKAYSNQITRENAEKLFRLSEQLCGIRPGCYGEVLSPPSEIPA